MKQLSPQQSELVSTLVKRLSDIHGVKAVVLGGSHARGHALPTSDIDLGLFYAATDPFSINDIRQLAREFNDTEAPVVTNFYEWGPWINGGAWLTIKSQRVDLLYRSFERMDSVIAEAGEGRYEIHYAQQPPFGYFSATYLGDLAVCVPLYDPEARVDLLKRRVAVYPEALRDAVVRDCLFSAEFTSNVSRKFAARSDTYGTTACLTRAVNYLVLVLFALNRTYLISDKTALAESEEFELSPREFAPRVQAALSHPGLSQQELGASIEVIEQLIRETIDLTGGLYQPRFKLPK